MRNIIFASAAAMAIALAPSVSAQTGSQESSTAMAAEQRSQYDSWPPERQRMYDAWQPDVQVYYWTLSPDQQTGWWLLTDDQRNQIYAMAPQQRAQAWSAINAQLAASQAAPMNNAPMARAGTANAGVNYVSNAMVQPIMADQAAYDGGDVPVCEQNEYDNCMNAWEAGRRGPNVTEPLEYWPGENADLRNGE